MQSNKHKYTCIGLNILLTVRIKIEKLNLVAFQNRTDSIQIFFSYSYCVIRFEMQKKLLVNLGNNIFNESFFMCSSGLKIGYSNKIYYKSIILFSYITLNDRCRNINVIGSHSIFIYSKSWRSNYLQLFNIVKYSNVYFIYILHTENKNRNDKSQCISNKMVYF